MERIREKPTAFSARTVATAALVCALSVLVPQVFHLIGGKPLGNAFLPMHLPVLLGGYLLNPAAAMLCGMLSPILGFLLTGMPAVPRLFFMIFELGAYGLFTSLFARKCRLPVFLSLPLSMLAGRAVYFLSLVFALNLLHLKISETLCRGGTRYRRNNGCTRHYFTALRRTRITYGNAQSKGDTL